MRKLIGCLIALLLLPAPLLAQEFDQETHQRFAEEAKRIEPVKDFVKREGRVLTVRSDSGKEETFVSTEEDLRCGGFNCDSFIYEGLYADDQFFHIRSLVAEFYTPAYLVSRKTGQLSDLVGPISDVNLSPDHQYIVNAVGGDAGPDGAIYVWKIEKGELKKVFEYSPPFNYANYTIHGWKENGSYLLLSNLGYPKECTEPNGRPGWGDSRVIVRRTGENWTVEEDQVKCKTQ